MKIQRLHNVRDFNRSRQSAGQKKDLLQKRPMTELK
jgi:hypothetical protein